MRILITVIICNVLRESSRNDNKQTRTFRWSSEVQLNPFCPWKLHWLSANEIYFSSLNPSRSRRRRFLSLHFAYLELFFIGKNREIVTLQSSFKNN